jgi:hypothetical protein
MAPVKPITPDDAACFASQSLPDAVLTAWNEIIAKKWDGKRAFIYQADILHLIISRVGCTREHVVDSGWLEIEPIFEAAGWKVEYDKPSLNPGYQASFTFTKKRGRK